MPENAPQLAIGNAACFSAGVNTAYNTATPAAYIKIGGAVFRDGEWHYYTTIDVTTLYAESSIILSPEQPV